MPFWGIALWLATLPASALTASAMQPCHYTINGSINNCWITPGMTPSGERIAPKDGEVLICQKLRKNREECLIIRDFTPEEWRHFEQEMDELHQRSGRDSR